MKVLVSILQATKPASPGNSPGVTRPAAGGNVFLEKAPVDYKTLIRRLLHRQARGVAPKPGPAGKPGLHDLNGLSKSTAGLGAGRVWQFGRRDLSDGPAVKEGMVEVLEFDAEQVSALGQDSVAKLVEQLASDSGSGQDRLVGINSPAEGIWTGQFVGAPRSDSAKGIGTSQFTDVVQGQGLMGNPETSLLNRMAKAEAAGTQIEDGTEDNPTQLSQGSGKSEINAAQQPQAFDIGPTVARAELPGQASQTAVNVLAALSAGERPASGGQVAAKVELGAVNTLGNTAITGPAVAVSGAFSRAGGERTHAKPTANSPTTAVQRATAGFGGAEIANKQGNAGNSQNGPLTDKAQGAGAGKFAEVATSRTEVQASDLPGGFQLGQQQQFVGGAVLSGQGNGAEQVSEEVSETAVVSQITQAFRAGNARTEGQLVIRLNPPELGEVRLEFQSEGKDLRAVLRVENSRTLVELQQEAPVLIERLGQSGVVVRRMDIVLNEQSNTDSPYAELQEDQSGQGQEHAEGPAGNFGDEVAGGSDELAQVDQSTYMQNQVSDSSINVWM